MRKKIPALLETIMDIEQVKVARLRSLPDFVPFQRSGDGRSGSGPRRVGSGNRLALIMLQVIEIDQIAAVLLEPLHREQLGMLLGHIAPDEQPDRAQLVEAQPVRQRHDELYAGSAARLGDRLDAKASQLLADKPRRLHDSRLLFDGRIEIDDPFGRMLRVVRQVEGSVEFQTSQIPKPDQGRQRIENDIVDAAVGPGPDELGPRLGAIFLVKGLVMDAVRITDRRQMAVAAMPNQEWGELDKLLQIHELGDAHLRPQRLGRVRNRQLMAVQRNASLFAAIAFGCWHGR
uniref:Predicted protein n=1 Tax=Physcomitrium patens TaxID=3218 RepID=A9U734_PHYPA